VLDGSGRGWLWLVLGVLAVWRATHLLHAEHGPWGLIARGRAASGRLGLGELFQCFFCLSLWTSAPVAFWLAPTWPGRVVAWLALSAGAIIVEVRLLGGPSSVGHEEKRDDDVLR
jgi:hypothetical protein